MSLRGIFIVLVLAIAVVAAWLFAKDTPKPEEVAALTPDGITHVAPSATTASPVTAPRVSRPPVSSAPAARPMKDEPLPPPNRPLAEIFPELERLAKSGNLDAMCRLGFEMERCHGLPGLRKWALENTLRAEESTIANPVFRQKQMEGVALLQRRVKEQEPICAGFPIEKTNDGWKYQLDAALAGHGPSMARFVWLGPPRDRTPLETLDAWIAYRDQGSQLLMRAVEAGEPGAFEIAAIVYERGQWQQLALAPKDPVRAAAYWMALERRAAPGYAGTARNWWQGIQRKAELTPAQIAEAERLANELAPKLRPPPGGVDFTRGTFGADDGTHCETR